MLSLSHQEVTERLNWQDVLTALENAFVVLAKNPQQFKNPERTVITTASGTYLTMPCADTEGWYGVKQASIMPDNPRLHNIPSIHTWYTLFNPLGQPSLTFDAFSLTNIRTSAVSAVAAKYLAPPQAQTLLIIGTGALAEHMAIAHNQVKAYKETLIWGRSLDKAELLSTKLQVSLDTKVQVVNDLASAANKADVISMATSAKEPILKAEWLRRGQHIDLVGAFKADMAEADPNIIKKADVFVDNLEACQIEAGDLIQAEAQGWSWGMVYGDLSDIVTNKVARQTPMHLTLFKSVGLALEDLVVAKLLSS